MVKIRPAYSYEFRGKMLRPPNSSRPSKCRFAMLGAMCIIDDLIFDALAFDRIVEYPAFGDPVPRVFPASSPVRLDPLLRLFGTYRAQPAAGHDNRVIGVDAFRTPQDLRIDRLPTQPFLSGAGGQSVNCRPEQPQS